MIRRFELYKVRQGTPAETLDKFETMFMVIKKYVPQVHESFIGRDISGSDVTHIWDHGLADWHEFLDIYMSHPYHICILDRYLLWDNPECITERSGKGGHVYYETESWQPSLNKGLKRLILFRIRSDADPKWMGNLQEDMRKLSKQVPGMKVSSAGQNLSGKIFRTKWTHVWEQIFEDEAALKRYLAHSSPVAQLDRKGWKESPECPVEEVSIASYWKDR